MRGEIIRHFLDSLRYHGYGALHAYRRECRCHGLSSFLKEKIAADPYPMVLRALCVCS